MANVSVTIAGAKKENVSAIAVGNRRWGDNGENRGTAQDIAPGRWVPTLYKTTPSGQISDNVNIPANGIVLDVAVNADSIRLQ